MLKPLNLSEDDRLPIQDPVDVQPRSDYKLDKVGRKIKAGKIKFMHGDDDGKSRVSEAAGIGTMTAGLEPMDTCMPGPSVGLSGTVTTASLLRKKNKDAKPSRVKEENMKKTYKDFKEQYDCDLIQQDIYEQLLAEVLSKDASAGEWIHDFVHSDNPKFAGKSKEQRKKQALAAYYAKQRNEEVEQIDEISLELAKKARDKAEHMVDMDHDDMRDRPYGYSEKQRVKFQKYVDKKEPKKEETVEEGWADMLSAVKQRAEREKKTTTATAHDVKHTSTGTVYTKQRDADGMSKEFKRDPNAAKRGRGRPKKNAFGEAVEFLMALDEETFDSLMEEGFDSFMEHYEQLDELSKSTLVSYVKKANTSTATHGVNLGHAIAKGKGTPSADKIAKRIKGVDRASDRLAK